jgi:hypothetical protein
MALPSYRRHRFPPEIIQHAIWLYLRFTLSYRDVEELLAERGLDISYETVRRWVLKTSGRVPSVIAWSLPVTQRLGLRGRGRAFVPPSPFGSRRVWVQSWVHRLGRVSPGLTRQRSLSAL